MSAFLKNSYWNSTGFGGWKVVQSDGNATGDILAENAFMIRKKREIVKASVLEGEYAKGREYRKR